MANFIDLIGKKYGRLTIIEEGKKPVGRRESYALCQCECGKVTNVSIYRLKKGLTLSCGCLQKEMFKKHNEIIIEGNIAKIRLGETNNFAIIDAEDLSKVKDYYWNIDEYGYAIHTKSIKNKTKKLRLHRLIVGKVENGKQTDHINQIKLDNRKENLRIVTPMENCNNRHRCKSWNKLGVKNIGKYKDTYSVRLTIMGKSYSCYGLKTLEEAIKKREEFKELYKKGE